MNHIPDPPYGSAIRIRLTEEGPMVWWPAYRRERVVVLLITVAVAIFGFGGAVALLLSFPVASLPAYFFVAAALLSLLSLVAVVFCVRLYGHLTESVLLARNGVTYAKPAPRGLVWRLLGWDDESGLLQGGLGVDKFIVKSIGSWRSIWRPRDEVAVPREAVTDLRVEGRGRFGHVTIALGSVDLDMGRNLSVSDRAWLLDTLQRWRRE
jgi:hypothetical protein